MQATKFDTSSANPEWRDQLSDQIRSARAKAGLTRKQLANASGASERYLAHLETGTGNPSIEMLLAVADALGISIAELLPMGGEKDELIAEVAALLRRMPHDRLEEARVALENGLGFDDRKWSRISLIGLRGAGKTSLGSALAEHLRVPFFDISKEVERVYGGEIGVLIEMSGTAALHRAEAEVLASISAKHEEVVIAAPGAVVANDKLYTQLLRTTHSVWLQATPKDHMDRVVAQGDLRPMAGNRSAMKDLETILAARKDDYSRADRTLDTSAQNFAQTLNALKEIASQFTT